MKTDFECVPCFIRQTLDTVRMTTDDPIVHERALRETLSVISQMDFQGSPVAMGRSIQRLIQQITGVDDPYKQLKRKFNRLALDLYPMLKQRVNTAADHFEVAARLALAGNMIDFGSGQTIRTSDVVETIEKSLSAAIFGDIRSLQQAVEAADTIIYLGDNCGEIVFDRLFIEQLLPKKVTYVVRAAPIINDVTMADAMATGMTERVNVIDSGSDAPGTLLEECSKSFKKAVKRSDLVIAKGQGNYETLCEIDKPVYFMLKAKCPVVARDIGCEIGSYVIKNNRITGCR
jgi:uncharacterized protein with ATP-grasp and redox domains